MPSDSSFSANASLVTLTGLCTRTLALNAAAWPGMKVRTAAPRSRATTLGTSRRAFIRGDLLADLESRVSMLFRDPRNEQERLPCSHLSVGGIRDLGRSDAAWHRDDGP